MRTKCPTSGPLRPMLIPVELSAEKNKGRDPAEEVNQMAEEPEMVLPSREKGNWRMEG